MPSTVIQLSTLPYYVGNFVDHSSVMFHPLFYTYSSCIEAFKYFKLFILVDDMHLYSKYGKTLLMVITKDGNSSIQPIAFTVIEGEKRKVWSFLLTNFHQYVTL